MERRRLRFSRIDLAAAQATSVTLGGEFEETERWNELLHNRSPSEPEPHPPFIYSLVRYPAKQPKHTVTAILFKAPGSSDRITLSVHYALAGGEEVSLPSDEPEALWISAATDLGEPQWFRGSARFRLAGKGGEDLWFPLPTRLGGKRNPADQFDLWEVRGIKLGKGDGENPEYGFSLESSSGTSARVEISFPLSGQFDPSLAKRVLDRGKAALADLVSIDE